MELRGGRKKGFVSQPGGRYSGSPTGAHIRGCAGLPPQPHFCQISTKGTYLINKMCPISAKAKDTLSLAAPLFGYLFATAPLSRSGAPTTKPKLRTEGAHFTKFCHNFRKKLILINMKLPYIDKDVKYFDTIALNNNLRNLDRIKISLTRAKKNFRFRN